MKPKIILAPHWRGMTELFDADSLSRLQAYDVVWGKDGPIPPDMYDVALSDAAVIITTDPRIDQATLDRAPHLRAVIEVSGEFPATIDYAACDAAGIPVLSCAPGFRQSVAEMGLAMALGSARGLVAEHERFRIGTENWLDDMNGRDRTLFGAHIGFVGFGQIARALCPLLAPFGVTIRAHDPWLPEAVAQDHGASLCDLDTVMGASDVVFVVAVPTSENHKLIGADQLALMSQGARLVLLSRAHLVDFDALMVALVAGRIQAAIDVFPTEPLAVDHPIRSLPGVILSPHRAAAVPGGRQLIGRLILDDLDLLCAGKAPCHLARADAARMASLTAVNTAASVADMAARRQD
ncbi:hypothetical protein AN189_08015 [Loktanella sp. 3ANDIMAR09]|uniref:NAD(P)-dependent oxidoreductase n=1 Tax=Loktanella sp. 3ANDIMAR09 TaxID=1225657 RepID=UPI0006FE78CB|nr:NAD(P)-dependent oxidoreductase [Loktanella sp. 3ANDIMAR09]KQI68810.1 hypothetical protein AN189_08015 [Loktanella sp. 3ANDIMAR09]